MKDNIFTKEDEKAIINHMNEFHINSLIHYCHLIGKSHISNKDEVIMTGIDQNGLNLKVKGEKVRYVFEKPMKNPKEVRKFLIKLAKKSMK